MHFCIGSTHFLNFRVIAVPRLAALKWRIPSYTFSSKCVPPPPSCWLSFEGREKSLYTGLRSSCVAVEWRFSNHIVGQGLGCCCADDAPPSLEHTFFCFAPRIQDPATSRSTCLREWWSNESSIHTTTPSNGLERRSLRFFRQNMFVWSVVSAVRVMPLTRLFLCLACGLLVYASKSDFHLLLELKKHAPWWNALRNQQGVLHLMRGQVGLLWLRN